MNIVIYRKVKKIQNELKRYYKLRSLCDCACHKYILTRNYLWSTTYVHEYHQDEIILYDDELTEVIREYCDKKINNLERRLNYYGKKYGRR